MEATYGEKNYTSRAIDVPNRQTLGVILLFIISHMCDVLCASVCMFIYVQVVCMYVKVHLETKVRLTCHSSKAVHLVF